MIGWLRHRLGRRGATLLEAVFAIIVAAILTSIMSYFFGDALTRSADPILRLKKSYYLNQIMEAVYNDYKKELRDNPYNPIAALANIKSSIAANKYGTDYTVVFNDFIAFNDPAATGPETITEKSSSPTVNDILKVTLKGGTGETLTALFTAKEN